MSFVITAVVAAVELGTVAAIATAVTYVGVAMTVVGTVTKSKELLGVGKVLSIGGGIASLGAAAYGAYSAAGSGAVTAAEAGGESLWSEAANQATADASANVATSAAENVTADTFAGAANSAADSAIGATEGIGASGASGASSGLASGFDTTANLAGDVGKAAGVSTSSVAPVASSIGEDVAAEKFALAAGSDAAGSTLGAAVSKPGIGQAITDWYGKLSPDAKNRVNTSLVQAGGSAIGGLFNGWSSSQKLDLEKQIYQDGIKRANAMPTVSFKSGLVANSTKGA